MINVKPKTDLVKLVWAGEPDDNRSHYGPGWGIDPHLFQDLRRIWRVLRAKGYSAKYVDIHDAWREYSDVEHSSGWLDFGKDDDVVNVLLRYLTKGEL